MLTLRVLVASSLLAACGGDSDEGSRDTRIDTDPDTAADPDTAPDAVETTPEVIEAIAFCTGPTAFAWDPDDATFLAAFPNDALTVDDPSALTGLRVKVGDPEWLTTQPAFFQNVWHQLEGLDGFGMSAGVMLRFSAPLAEAPSGSTSASSDRILFLELGDPVVQLPFETEVLDDGATLVLWPMRPLREGVRHGVIVTNAQLAADGECVAPSPALQALLSDAPDKAPAAARLSGRYAELVAAAATKGVTPGDISAATVFTTQMSSQPTLHQRDNLLTRTFAWKAPPDCVAGDDIVSCRGEFTAFDYRIHGYLGQALDPTFEPARYQLPVHVWLPTERSGPVPLLVFGHGLGGGADQAEQLAELAVERGMATMAISAPSHGDHPTAQSSDPQAVFTAFFGIDLQSFSIDGFVFRENVRQAAFDKLQVLELLRAHPDVDGDGTADVDLGRVAYWGISLGGILGPNFLAMSDVSAAVLSVPGARLISIVSEAKDFKQFFDLLAQISGGPDNLLRQAGVAQSLIDGADPVSWATHIFKDPIGRPDSPAPHVLLQMVMNDTTVPNIATRSLARALEVPQIPAVVVPIDLLETEAEAPVHANIRAGLTAGIFQLDRYTTTPGGRPKVATHAGVFSGIEAIGQVTRFLDSWLESDDAVPTIVDPYADNETPPL